MPQQDPFAAYVVQPSPAAAPSRDPFAEFAVSAPALAPVAPAKPSSGWPAKIFDVAGDLAIGAAKGVGSTVSSLGEMAVNAGAIPGVQPRAFAGPEMRHPAFTRAEQLTTPTSTAQKVGKGVEQIAEVLIPGAAITKAQKGLSLARRAGVEAGANAGISAAQGGSPTEVGLSGALGAAIPGVGAVAKRAAGSLEDAASKQVVEALGPTKERFKAMAERLTPEILRRGLRGSRDQIKEQAAEAASVAGDQIDAAIQQFGGRAVDTGNIVDALESAKNAFRTSVRRPFAEVPESMASKVVRVEPDGTAVVAHEFEPRAIRQLDGLQAIIRDFGPEIRADQLISIRRAWDKVVDQAGGFSHRAGGAIGVPLKDQSEAAAKKAATTAIREQLNAAVPELSALNKEFSFWKSLDDVISQTLKRTQPQGPGLARTAAEVAGNVVGGAAGMSQGPTGAVTGAFALGKLGKMAQTAFSSPRWKLMSAGWKDDLAEAIVNEDVSKMAAMLGRIAAVEGPKVVR